MIQHLNNINEMSNRGKIKIAPVVFPPPQSRYLYLFSETYFLAFALVLGKSASKIQSQPSRVYGQVGGRHQKENETKFSYAVARSD